VAVDGDDTSVLSSLIAAQMTRARAAGIRHLVLGFPDRHPFQAVVRNKWAHHAYRSVLHVAYWEDGDAFVRSLDHRPAQPEVAVL
jgi:hypothetical protein